MLNILISIIGIIVTLLLIIGIHEFSHFIVARLLGIKVLRFSIGFGKKLWSCFDKKGTEYVIAAIPLGGYVKMLDAKEETVSIDDLPLTYDHQPFYKKFLVVVAGPLSNLLLAFVLYWMLFMMGFSSIAPIIGKITPHSIFAEAGIKSNVEITRIDNIPTSSWMGVLIRILSRTGDTSKMQIGVKPLDKQTLQEYQINLANWHMDNLKPDPLTSLGIEPYEPEIPAIIDKINANSPAAESDLSSGDKILAINGKKIANWLELVTEIDKRPTEKINLTIERAKKQYNISVTTGSERDLLFKKHGFLGVTPQFKWPDNLIHKNQYNPFIALSHAWQNTMDFTYLNLVIIGKLFTGKVSLQSLGGPISIFQTAGTALNQGIAPFLSFLAFLSISIGIINIFPIPGLDGGHLLFQTIEAIIRRPISDRVLALFYRIGFILIFLLIVQSIINDVLRL